jgi:hypothetical protein
MYEITGSGSIGLTVSYTDSNGKQVDIQDPSLPWRKWVTREIGNTIKLYAHCNFPGKIERDNGECYLKGAKLKNPDNVQLADDGSYILWNGGLSDVEIEYEIED